MDFLLSDDERVFSEILRELFSRECSSSLLRKHIEDEAGSSVKTLWKRVSEVGSLSASFSEDFGGSGLGDMAASVVLYESTKTLAPIPIFETVALAIPSLFATNNISELCSDLLEKLGRGERRATAAFQEFLFTEKETPAFDCHIEGEGGECSISGQASFVPFLAESDVLLVPVQVRGEPEDSFGLATIEISNGKLPGGKFRRLDVMDLVRPYYSLTLKASPGRLLSPSFEPDRWAELRRGILLHVSAELSGVARGVLDMTVEYVKTRKQFGREIGSFQAMQHKLADMAVLVSECESFSRFAAWCSDNDQKQFKEVTSALKAYCSDSVPKVCEMAIQAHGGIGFTWDYNLHLYLRRAHMMSQLFGSAGEHYDELSSSLLRN